MTSPPEQVKTAFISGCGHSGTTLVATMLATHPSIYVPLVETAMFSWDSERTAALLDRLRQSASKEGRSVLVEKTPAHVRFLDQIGQHDPEARLILMARDGRDVAASIGKRKMGDFQGGVDRWVADNTHLLRASSNPLAYLLRYEDLIENPGREVAAVCEFIGVAYDPVVLDYHRSPRLWYGRKEIKHTSGVGGEHEDLRNWQVNQPIFDGRGRWKTTLPPEYAAQFDHGPAGELMELLGYANDPPERLSGALGPGPILDGLDRRRQEFANRAPAA